jgi:hypothetical protein
MSKISTPRMSRRQLVIAGAGAAGVLGAAAALPGVRQASPTATDTRATPDRGGGYQVTEHVLHYYRTARV